MKHLFVLGVLAVQFFLLPSAIAQTDTPSLEEQCRALMVDPPPLGNPPESIRFLEPFDGAEIYGGTVNVRVQPINFELSENAGHWHFWVDNRLVGMVYQDRAIIQLEPGTHRLCAFLGSETHSDLGIPTGITITVREALTGTPTSAPDPQASAPLPEPSPSPLLIIVLGGAAALGGIFIGSRLGKRPAKK